MPATTDNRVVIDAPFATVWDLTNDVASWPTLFTEYAKAEILGESADSVRFRLTTVPDPDGSVWTWVSERFPDRDARRVTAHRIETGPFEYMRLRWDYRDVDGGVELRWRQEFAVRPGLPFDDAAMTERLNRTSAEQLQHIKSVIEARAGAGPGSADAHRERLTILTCGLRLAHVVGALAELGVAEILAEGPRPVDELAGKCGADPDALYRVLRMAASFGVFTETEPGVFDGTPLSGPMRADLPYSLRPLIAYGRKRFFTEPYGALLHTLRTGRPATVPVLGTDFWGYLREHPDDEQFFDAMMTELGRWETERHLARIEPERYARIADLGGGHGHFLGAALRRAPETRGILVDRPSVLADAGPVLSAEGVDNRVELRPGDFFGDPLPADADAYFLKAVLHNWPDAQAEALLRRVRSAIGDREAPLFVVEQVVSPGNGFDHGKVLDIDMLVLFGGRERTVTQWRDLFADTGFRLTGKPETGRWTVLRADPA
ncbi:methyltransferase [Amycolatopsis sp. Hca4]|uniref:methyltransferase n=1 Tax=Amycolatopsis sp. Hca4 TaxID=2742131 RepID=UPI0015910E06|nr:SRPBCC family protein [Amycolatopsis sp. Hca4]